MDLNPSPAVTVNGSGAPFSENLILDSSGINRTTPTINPTTAHNQGAEALKDVVCGSAAGIVGKYIEYPFDTVKVRLQSQPDHLPLRYTGPLDCFKQALRQDGFLGIYRGISAPLVGAAVENACLFFSYRIAQDGIRASGLIPSPSTTSNDLPYSALLLCGAFSGAVTSLFLTPIELVKCKMQVPLEGPSSSASASTLRKPTIPAIIASIYRHHGLMGYWHGQLGTLIRETGGGVAWFGGFEGMKLLFRRSSSTTGETKTDDDLPVYQRMLAGAAAGVAYNFLFYPADTVKSRMQTEEVKALTGEARSTFSTVGRAIWRQHGLRGLYRGCGITCARSVPSSAFIFTVYEELKGRWPEGRKEE
ncbi:amino-acid transporter arg-13 [Westerdykella ornata]|uniref:Amino-acid transporter arg-13 n=1 Tax=Westerdykella ornata TaxID=318751 RepID=A0A6A6JMJ1_WESOR|nr:amino-acid transporter arg-13 [Westerdykella ornata]KAF2277454.1 amino-acid transporter arg-13 [Westerdykella ornata]